MIAAISGSCPASTPSDSATPALHSAKIGSTTKLDHGSIARSMRCAGDSRRSWIASSARNAGADGPWRSTSWPCARLGGEHRIRLRHQRIEIGRRPRGDEERKQHAGERGVQPARVHAGPERDAEKAVGHRAIHARAIEQREQHDDGRGARQVRPLQRARIEQRDDHDGADVVDDRRRSEEHAQLHRHALAEHHDERDRERGVGRHRNAPAVAPCAGRDHERVQARGHRHAAERGRDRKRGQSADSRGGPR